MNEEVATMVVKNSGRIEPWDIKKLLTAIGSALVSSYSYGTSYELFAEVERVRQQISLETKPEVDVSEIHDAVERAFFAADLFEAGREYISTRDAKRREMGRPIPPNVRAAFEESKEFFPTPLQQFQVLNKYSRYDHELGRRETWRESVSGRVMPYLRELAEAQSPGAISEETFSQIEDGILNLRIMPSMRLLAMAGPAAQRNNIALYNCSYQGIDHPYAFVETLIISMNGCGAGFSVERKFVDQLPKVGNGDVWRRYGQYVDRHGDVPQSMAIPLHLDFAENILYVVPDSADGWAKALWVGLNSWFQGFDNVEFDYSKVREAGAVLKTKGGTSSGPAPLRKMLSFIKEKILSKKGERLSTVDVHDIQCVIGDCVVQGGVRRSAMISGFDWDDLSMRTAKHGNWFPNNPQRSNANNSCVWPNRELTDAEVVEFMMEMDSSGSGENGIYSRRNAVSSMPARRLTQMSPYELERIFTNPCGEIILRHNGFCNLSIAVARPGMTIAEMRESVRLAAIIGTIQSTATHFPGLRSRWKENCEEERLLGVDITGQADVDFLTELNLRLLKDVAVDTNKAFAEKLGIRQSAAVTCVKPSGNSSVLLDCSPGINRRWSPFQIRRTRISANGVMAKVLKAAGVPLSPENGEIPPNVSTYVVSWPARTKRQEDPTTRERCAVAQCEVWKLNKLNWTEHNPSVTITYHKEELADLITWVKENQNIIGGMAFLPASEKTYDQMPNEEITEKEYHEMVRNFPDIDFAMLYAYEHSDTTTSAQELACVGGACALEVT